MEGGPPVFSPDSSCPLILWIPLRVLCISSTGLSPAPVGFSTPFDYTPDYDVAVHTPHVFLLAVWPLPLSLAATHRISFDFSSSPYLDVSLRGVPHVHLWIQCTFHGSSPWEFPHSEIRGSKLICSSPRLIAACHVLHRLLMPRHSPYALVRLNFLLRDTSLYPL